MPDVGVPDGVAVTALEFYFRQAKLALVMIPNGVAVGVVASYIRQAALARIPVGQLVAAGAVSHGESRPAQGECQRYDLARFLEHGTRGKDVCAHGFLAMGAALMARQRSAHALAFSLGFRIRCPGGYITTATAWGSG